MTIFRDNPGLLVRFREGEEAALRQVYDRYIKLVAHVASRAVVVGGSSRRRLELSDLVQEIFARAFAKSARLAFDGIRDYQPYLLTLARNVIVDAFRKQQREPPLEAIGEELAADPEETRADPRVLAAIETYLAAASPDERLIHEQRYILSHSQDEAAAALGVSRQTVRTREAKLRDGLRKFLRRHKLTPS